MQLSAMLSRLRPVARRGRKLARRVIRGIRRRTIGPKPAPAKPKAAAPAKAAPGKPKAGRPTPAQTQSTPTQSAQTQPAQTQSTQASSTSSASTTGAAEVKKAPAKPKPKPVKKPEAALRAELRHLSWSADDSLQLSGWAYLTGVDTLHDNSDLRLWLEPPDTAGDPTDAADGRAADRIPLSVTRGENASVDVAADEPGHQHAAGWFTAEIPADVLAERTGTWRVLIELSDVERVRSGGFDHRAQNGSAGRPVLHRLPDGSTAQPCWKPAGGGLLLQLSPPAPAADLTVSDDDVAITVTAADGAEGDQSRLGIAAESGEVVTVEDGHVSAARLAELPSDFCGTLVGLGPGDEQHDVLARQQPGTRLIVPGLDEVTLQVSDDGRWQVRRRSRWAELTGVVFDPEHDQLQVDGLVYPADGWESVRLSGQREQWPAPIALHPDPDAGSDTSAGHEAGAVARFSARIPLLGEDFWGHQGLAPLGGHYRLELVGSGSPGQEVEPQVGRMIIDRLPDRVRSDRMACQFEVTGQALRITIGAPTRESERGKRHQAQLQTWSRQLTDPVVDAVYFESFGGKFASCSPRAIFDRLHELAPQVPFYWGIRDHSVPAPDGSVPVVMHSREWWRIRTTSRFLVTNSWMQKTFAKRPGQVVLQTWHGTPYKRLALDRENQSKGFAKAVRTESAKWDRLAVQSEYMAEAMASAYAYQGEMLRSGYPRNDIVSRPEGDAVRTAMRHRLGIGDDQLCLLYAPTWREDRSTMVDELDLVELARRLGDRYVILARGHGNVLRRDHDHSGAGVIDVTSYPDATHLFLAADVGMTDYSSVMFDFTATGKPLLFFVPDLDRYTSTLRGTYFDLGELAPGPLLKTLDEVVEAVQGLDEVNRTYQGKYQSWQQRFNTWDDGSATDRVLAAVFAEPLGLEVAAAAVGGGSEAGSDPDDHPDVINGARSSDHDHSGA